MSADNHSEKQPQPPEELHIDPPTALAPTLRYLGPGLIIAGSIVGSGELIATTKTGAEAGFTLLWLILIGCVIKVFTQVEFGRYTIIHGKTSLEGMNEVPGPRVKRVNWLVFFWMLMFMFSIAQLGGIVTGVGQALALSVPIKGDFKQLLQDQRDWDKEAKPIQDRLYEDHLDDLKSKDLETRKNAIEHVNQILVKEVGRKRPQQSYLAMSDDMIWAGLITIITAILLVVGRYSFIQVFSTIMVGSFTLLTIVNLGVLQSHAEWSISFVEIKQGLMLGLPQPILGKMYSPLATALATFGIIGVGASELVSYPYWCLEKGYARFTGKRNDSKAWEARANGWLRILRIDAWSSMVLYTFATVAFYLLGASVLFRKEMNPEKDQLIYILGEMYTPVFGEFATLLFLFGSIAVLYSTFFIANAGHARVVSDALRMVNIIPDNPQAKKKSIRVLSGLFPMICFTIAFFVRAPAMLVLASGLMQAILLPMLGGAAIYFRYYRCDKRVMPGKAWDFFLWLSCIGLLVAGGWAAISQLFPALKLL